MGQGMSARGLEGSIYQVESLLGPFADEGLSDWGNTSRGRHDVCDKRKDEVKKERAGKGSDQLNIKSAHLQNCGEARWRKPSADFASAQLRLTNRPRTTTKKTTSTSFFAEHRRYEGLIMRMQPI